MYILDQPPYVVWLHNPKYLEGQTTYGLLVSPF